MDAFAALADPTRRGIVALLARGERPAGEIAAQFNMSAPAISQHLKVLREAKLVAVRPDAQRRFYALAPKGIAEIEAWVADVRRFWTPRLDALEAALKADARRRRKRDGK